MRRLLVSLALVAVFLGGRIVIGQEPDRGRDKDDPFFDRSDRGEVIHVFPGHEAAASRSAHGPYSFAPASRRTAVYPASYHFFTLSSVHGPISRLIFINYRPYGRLIPAFRRTAL